MKKRIPDRVQIGWQIYIRRGFRDHQLRSGDYIEMVKVEAPCAHCGRPFVSLATKSDWRARRLSRRCQRHRARGIWVDNLKPPVPLADLPAAFRPDRKLIRKTAKCRRYAKGQGTKKQRSAASAKPPGGRKRPTSVVRPGAPAEAPLQPSYLD